MLHMDFIHLATVLSQSVNLYRMDADYNIDLVVGDATKTFPDGSISGLGERLHRPERTRQPNQPVHLHDPDLGRRTRPMTTTA